MNRCTLLFFVLIFSGYCYSGLSQSLPSTGGTLTGSLYVVPGYQIQAPYYGFNSSAPQPSTSANVAIFPNNTSGALDIIGWNNGWHFVPNSVYGYSSPIASLDLTGNFTIRRSIDLDNTGVQFSSPFSPGRSNDIGGGQTPQFLLISPTYTSGTTSGGPSAGFSGKLSFYRGSAGSFNFNAEYRVSIQAAYNSTMANIIPDNGISPLLNVYTVVYQSQPYIAIRMSEVVGTGVEVNLTGFFWNNVNGQKPFFVDESAVTFSTFQNYQPLFSNVAFVSVNRNIGLETANPLSKLHINAGANASAMLLQGDNGFSIKFKTYTGGQFDKTHRISQVYSDNTNDINGYIDFIRGADAAGGALAFGSNGIERMRISPDGHIGIATTATGRFTLAVEGEIGARKLTITHASPWPDYIFEPDYKLATLDEVEKFINENKHLPDLPSAKQVKDDGIDIGENQALLLKKIEELTLYMIELKKENEAIKEEVRLLKKRIVN